MRIKIRGLGGCSAMPILLIASLGAANSDLRLVEAVERQNKEAVRALLKQRVDVNARQADGATALHWAAHWNDLETADQLIRAGAQVNAVNELGVPPLSLACANANAAMVEKLLSAGADANAALPSGERVLMTGARTGSVEVVKALLAHGADVNANKHWRGQTALMWAVAESHPAVVKVLIENGADVGARSKAGTTPLLLAARAGDLESARLLLAAGADVNAAEPLVELGEDVDVNETPPSGNSPLLVASASLAATSGFEYNLVVKPSGHEALALFLLEKGADPTKADSIGTTPLHAAVQTGKRELVKALLAHGANPNARLAKAPPPYRGDFVSYEKYAGATPFWLATAARVPDLNIMRVLVAAGADPNQAAQDGTTPLMAAVGMVQNEARLASESQALEVVRLAVELGVDVNTVDQSGQTALHGAARYARNTIIQFLAEHGAMLNVKDKRGRTALDIAQDSLRPRESTASLLRQLEGGLR
jgi:uncharacterized protein